MMQEDTIAAIATPPGEGGLALIRISGRDALAVADLAFRTKSRAATRPSTTPTHTVLYGHVFHHGLPVDEVLLTVLRAPRTFTREDVVEISCHGGMLAAKSVLEAVLANGARLAEPGEFTRRAFLNGRMDLTQAEAVIDVIRARTELALRAANAQLAGTLSRRVNTARDEMLQTLAYVEAHIDFPDEDIPPQSREDLLRRLQHAGAFMDDLLRTAAEGQILRHGIRAAIVGRPNAGKSSLLNQLLGRDRAIVSALPGTTRDTIEETANIRGIPVVFIDTAGLREGSNEVEREGIRRSRQSLETAELVLHVLDASEPFTPADHEYLAEGHDKKRILVRNKIDLPQRLELPPPAPPSGQTPGAPPSGAVVDVSCVTGAGIEALKDAIRDRVWSGAIGAGVPEAMINSRHEDALKRSRCATGRAIGALEAGQTLEIAAMDLRIAVNALGEIIGKTVSDDLLDMIFSRFCIGK